MKEGDIINIPKSMDLIEVGLGWKTQLDLDSSIITLGADGTKFGGVSFSRTRSNDGAIVHKGDNRTGAGAGDNENIIINLRKVDPRIDSIWPVIAIYTRKKQFDDVRGVYCRLIDAAS